MTETLPPRPLTDDVVDRIAREIAAQVTDHIETMYPPAAAAVAWKSASRSIQGVVRIAVATGGRTAEKGEADAWTAANRRHRRTMRTMREQS